MSLLSHLQQGVFRKVQMMRLAWMCRPRPELGCFPLGDRTGFRVRCDRLPPHPEHGVGMRGHMLGMLRRRSNLCVSVSCIKTALRERRVIVSVDEIVQNARMIR